MAGSADFSDSTRVFPGIRSIGLDMGGSPRSNTITWCLVAAMACALIRAAAAQDDAPSAPRLPDLVRTKHRVFAIPFRLPQATSPDAAPQRVTMSVSRDLGGTWEAAGEVAPGAGSFTYRAEADGEYWFRIRAIDAKGRSRGGDGPDIRVLVDAAGPKIAGRVWKGADGEIICRYAATDDSLKMDSLKVEYRGQGDQGWKAIAAEGILSREAPAHMVGEDIWWAGEKVETLVVRITIADSAGNQSVKQFKLEPADPNVDQVALARELGVPPLPTREVPLASDARASAGPLTTDAVAPPAAAPPALAPASGNGWATETGSSWSAEQPRASAATGAGAAAASPQSVLVNRFVSRDASAKPTAPSSPAADATPRAPLEYRGRPLQLVKSKRFAWDYDFQNERTDNHPMRVELWYTRDGGVTWQQAGVDTDATSPIDVSLPAAGLYGFRLEIVPDLPDAGGGPRSGDVPETWVGIDDEPPQVEIVSVSRAKSGEPGGVLIRYACRDQLLAPRSVRIAYSPHPSGPWSTLADSLDAQGEHRWQPERSSPARVYLRIEATDAAGNVGSATTPEPHTVATARVVGRLRGVRELPASPAAGK